jgi:hypothetical protein
MKKITLTLLLIAFSIATSWACDISFKIEKEKNKYKAGDELVVKVTVVLIHSDCPIALKSTNFKASGLKILSGTEWKEISKGTWERKVKIKVLEGTPKPTLIVTRTCHRDGGKGVLTIKM